MTWQSSFYAVMAGSLLGAQPHLRADPLAAASLPEKTRWVIHLDFDAARQARPLLDFVHSFPMPPRNLIQTRFDALLKVTGINPARDLHDLTLSGSSFDDATACLRIHGTLDKEKITAYLRNDPQFHTEDRNGHDIMQWTDKDDKRMMFVSFAKDDVVVISQNLKVLSETLDTLDTKSPAVPADSSLLPSFTDRQAPPMLWLAGDSLADLPRLQKTESPLLTQMVAASLSMSWDNDKLLLQSRMVATDEKSAQQMQSIAEGVKAFVALSAGQEHAPPQMRMVESIMETLTTQRTGKTLQATLAPDLATIKAIAESVQQELDGVPVTLPEGKQ